MTIQQYDIHMILLISDDSNHDIIMMTMIITTNAITSNLVVT